MLLFSYSRSVFSGRKIAEMGDENLVMRWLMGNIVTVPSYRTINRFRVHSRTKTLIKRLYGLFRTQLASLGLIDDSALYIDGTKLAANANKYTFVWRKSVEKNEPKLDEKSNQLYDQIIQNKVDLAVRQETEGSLDSDELKAVSDKVSNEIDNLNQVIAKKLSKIYDFWYTSM